MREMNRREALGIGVVGAVGLAPAMTVAQSCADDLVSDDPSAQTWAEERAKVMSLGFTADEANCWELINRAAASFLELPELHPSDNGEVAEAVHIIQNKLMGRPTYRRYIRPGGP